VMILSCVRFFLTVSQGGSPLNAIEGGSPLNAIKGLQVLNDLAGSLAGGNLGSRD